MGSCNHKKESQNKIVLKNEVVIPLIKKSRNNTGFKLKNGILFFNEKQYSGTVEEYYSKGKLKSTATYYQGKKNGFFNGWYMDGSKWFKRFYTNGLKSGVHEGWFDNGKPMFEYHFNTKGLYNGKVTEWYKNGNLLKEFHFKEGKEDGSQKMWQQNGKIKANFVTKEGERFGLIGLKKCYTINTVNEEFK
ncbi:toxin-antitoxin system YwqK family antitoxin [Tenacibaculum ovolyticum]|uniref:toxin-antitoxin system YwqK family antitoxin n=1 Tax=Tenacibaculum ovolyticum TaxID=104270 RepID=UPI003BAD9BED